jgi:hypothetical protein
MRHHLVAVVELRPPGKKIGSQKAGRRRSRKSSVGFWVVDAGCRVLGFGNDPKHLTVGSNKLLLHPTSTRVFGGPRSIVAGPADATERVPPKQETRANGFMLP